MNELLIIIGNPYFWGLVFLYWIFNAFVEALPEPDAASTKKYQFAYKFFNILSGNVQTAFGSKIPGTTK